MKAASPAVEEKLEYVGTFGGVRVLPLSTAAYYSHADVTHVPIDDIGPHAVCPAWRADRHSPLMSEPADIAFVSSDALRTSLLTEEVLDVVGGTARRWRRRRISRRPPKGQ
ncbi:hypothetical protein ABZV67_39850 [Streptomyces sp. NPDC005065]|uniref:hypothetical protein n=1 Tax=Streptomyces sp. NPDC005065 TaxID=3154461 RepID=UPI0033A943DE